jgi:protoporphyrin/coproporphyrin ferrochelatase
MSRTAVILFNLGGPDRPGAVRPFLFNLFNDRAIIALPQPLRWLIALLIAGRRAAVARAIYDKIGGSSPLLANTEAQARALEAALGPGHRCFIAMRYWHPLSEFAARAV